MKRGRYLDRNSCPETKKAQAYYALSSLYEVMVFSFMTLYLNEARKNLGWASWMSSLSLFLPPFVSAVSIFVSSFFVTHHKNNLKAMRVLTLISFAVLLSFACLGLYLPNGLGAEGDIANYGQYYGLFALMVIFPPVLMGLHRSFLSFQISNIADINYMEKTRFGHVCVFAPLVSMVISPLAGYISNSVFQSYRGYLFLFLLSSPLLLLEFGLTFIFHSYDPSCFHDDEDESVPLKQLFSNKEYCFYLLVAAIWVPSMWAGDSLVSSYWTSLEATGSNQNAFNGLTYGCFLSVSYLLEFLMIYFNTKIGFGKRLVFSMNLALGILAVGAISFGVLSYFFRLSPEEGLWLALTVISLHAFKGVGNGLYCSSNLSLVHHILGPKYRRKAVFLAPAIYQLINSILQLVYPFLSRCYYAAFFGLGTILLIGFVLSLFLDGPLLHWKNEGK